MATGWGGDGFRYPILIYTIIVRKLQYDW